MTVGSSVSGRLALEAYDDAHCITFLFCSSYRTATAITQQPAVRFSIVLQDHPTIEFS